MPDITMCMGGDCELKEKCYRYTAKVNIYSQSYFSKIPYWNSQSCQEYWDNTPISKTKTKCKKK